jgi:hypothetical protein
MDAIRRLIGRARRREFFGRFLRALSYVLPGGGAVAAAIFVLRSFGWAGPLTAVVLSGLGVATLAAATLYAACGLSTRRLARRLDQRARLHDRLTNALDFAARPRRSPLMELAIADAEALAPTASPAALIPLWNRQRSLRLVTLSLIAPLLYLAAAVNLASWLKKPVTPEGAGANIALPGELAPDGLRWLPRPGVTLPALANLRGVIVDWRERLTVLREKARELAPPQKPALPETIYRETPAPVEAKSPQILAADGLPAVRNTDRLHPSDARALSDVDPDIDPSLRMAYSQLDENFLQHDPRLEAIVAAAESLRAQAIASVFAGRDLKEFLADAHSRRAFASSSRARVDAADGDVREFREGLLAVQAQSMEEFLAAYARHLERLVTAKEDTLAKRQQKQKDNPSQTASDPSAADQGQEIPPGAELRLVQPTEEMIRGFKLTNDFGGRPGETLRAGQGGGTFRGAIKVKHEELTAGGPKETLAGQIGAGKSSVQILEDAENGDAGTLAALLRAFRDDTEDRLRDETIPLPIRSYVQRYLASIAANAGP